MPVTARFRQGPTRTAPVERARFGYGQMRGGGALGGIDAGSDKNKPAEARKGFFVSAQSPGRIGRLEQLSQA